MAKVDLTEHGLLPVGVHECTLDEISDQFGRFWRSDKRLKLMDELRRFVDAVRKVDQAIQIVVDGSFIMGGVDEPGDIDVLLILPTTWDLSDTDLQPFKYNIVSKKMVKRLHGFDLFIAMTGDQAEAEAKEFLSRVNVKWIKLLGIPAGTRKGLLRVQQ